MTKVVIASAAKQSLAKIASSPSASRNDGDAQDDAPSARNDEQVLFIAVFLLHLKEGLRPFT
ncbi:MAG: hypothetical protein A3F16_01990 [Deltaproteobacteria bacterium RIFCSPHIGHO2_12_FULL_43_9]|nr:MAG: hypothetical protein A3F16_01990 [Deltaproteobacteria bacterium RIFCSPHIGHO2_12_FULL_43_9]